MIGKWNLQMLQTRFEHNLGHGSNVAFFPLWLYAVAWNPLFLAPIYPSITRENISCLCCAEPQETFRTDRISPGYSAVDIISCFLSKDTPFHQMFSEKESHRLICLALVDLKRQIWTFQHFRGNLIWHRQLLWIYSDHYYDYEMTATDIIVDSRFFLNAQSWYQNLESRVTYIISIMIFFFFTV